MKELPYFRFTCQEWDSGDISLENDSVKGLFVSVCSYYWSQSCLVLYSKLLRKFPKKTKKVSYLVESGLIKRKGDYVNISFLDLQLAEITQKSKLLSAAGKKGVEARAKKKEATLKPPLSNKDKDKDKDKENDKDNINKAVEIIEYFNQVTGKNFRANSEKTRSVIKTRLSEGFTIANFKTVIFKKCQEWIGTSQEKYLRPETLFGNKFEGYLNQSGNFISSAPKSGLDETAEYSRKLKEKLLNSENQNVNPNQIGQK